MALIGESMFGGLINSSTVQRYADEVGSGLNAK